MSGAVRPEGEGIAIVGMACRLPGADNPDAFAARLFEGRHAFTALTEDELLEAGVSPQMLADPRYVRSAAVLDDIAGFDADFFGLSHAEAELLDPQHRIFLEAPGRRWRMRARAPGSPAASGAVGVFASASISAYLLFNLLDGLAPGASAETMAAMIGNEKDYLASRTAYLLGLEGPAIGVQTACSSSLVGVHLAAQSLLAGECDMALAGGVNVRVPHRVGHRFEEGSILSPTGRCRAFEARADGTVFGSGAGVVGLRRLADARRDGDPIHAVILGSAVNNDGRGKAGFTAPGFEGQSAVVAEALGVAGVEARTISYVEAHGTGTPIGDPIELAALNEAFALPCGGADIAVGTAKSIVGHLEAAAGVTGLIAAALAVREGRIPRLADFQAANPRVPFADGPFVPATHAARFAQQTRRAGVSSFGIGGTNAHVVIEAPPAPAAPPEEVEADQRTILALSAPTEGALRDLIAAMRASVSGRQLMPMARTAAFGRRPFAHRAAVAAATGDEAAAALASAVVQRAADAPKLAFIFSGQGTLTPLAGPRVAAMGTAAARSLDAACAHHPAVREALFDPSADLANTALAQPGLVALQLALATELGARGVRAGMAVGHSIGEVSAAATAGLIGEDDAVAFAVRRGAAMAALGPGAMAAVALSVEECRTALGDHPAVSIAAINAPRSVVLSGPQDDVAEVLAALAREGVSVKRLGVNRAFHSAMVEPSLGAIGQAAPAARPRASPFVSTLTGGLLLALAPGHWTRHARAPVEFAAALTAAVAQGATVFLEIGPGPTLTRFAAAHGSAVAALGDTGDRGEAGAGRGSGDLLAALAALHQAGVDVDLAGIVGAGPRGRMPTTPFSRTRHWREPRPRPVPTAALAPVARPPGRPIATPSAKAQWGMDLGATRPAWLCDHRVDGKVVMPAAAYAALALAAGLQSLGPLVIEAPLGVPDDGVEVHTVLQTDGSVAIFAGSATGFRRHATVLPAGPTATAEAQSLDAIRGRLAAAQTTLYDRLSAAGIALGPAFQVLSDVRHGAGEALARLDAPHDPSWPLHPITIDAMLQALAAAVGEGAHARPVSFDALSVHSAAPPAFVHATVRQRAPGTPGLVGDAALLAGDGRVVASLEGIACRPAASAADTLYRIAWRPRPHTMMPKPRSIAGALTCADNLADYPAYLEALDRLCADYAARAVDALGGPHDAMAAAMPGFARAMPRIIAMAADGGDDPAHGLERLRAEFPAQSGETEMLARCGADLASILTGKTDPLTVLFARDADTASLYAQSPYAAALSRLAADALTAALAKGAAPTVLEIGGGTGGTTGHLLEVLHGRYRFSDISPAFLAAAAERWGEREGFETLPLDIEAPPAGEQTAHDVVVAANVLHATRDLAAAVGHARERLKPGGWLVLVEGLRPSRWLDLTFALTEGWWRGTDRALRPDGPLVSAETWRAVLADAGFDDTAVLTPGEGRLADQGVILARRAPPAGATVLTDALTAQRPVDAVLHKLQAASPRPGGYLVATRGAVAAAPHERPDPAQAEVAGLVRAVRVERPELGLRLIDLDPNAERGAAAVPQREAVDDGAGDVALRAGERLAIRLERAPTHPALPPAFRMGLADAGRPETLAAQPIAVPEPGPGEVRLRIHAAGLNFKDVLTALAMVPGNALGGECAGVVEAAGEGATLAVGTRVVALAGGTFASHVVGARGKGQAHSTHPRLRRRGEPARCRHDRASCP